MKVSFYLESKHDTDLNMWQCHRRRHARSGIVIREVVLLLIVPMLLLSLLLPAIHAAREAARRMMCSNNLRQHALAMFNFESNFRRFPSGCTASIRSFGDRPPSTSGKYLYAWGSQLLPYQELNYAYNVLESSSPADLEGAFQQPQARKILESPYSVYRCPSDVTAPLLNIGRSFELSTGENAPIALSNYVAANGSTDLMAGGGVGEANGVFFVNSSLKVSSILDGSSNTIMLGERAWRRKNWDWYNSRAAVIFGVRSIREQSFYGVGDAMAAGRFRINFEAVAQPDGLGQSYIRRGFSSNHVGGAQFARADGSVLYLSQMMDNDIDPETQTARTEQVDSVWERLLSRNDGQEIDLDF